MRLHEDVKDVMPVSHHPSVLIAEGISVERPQKVDVPNPRNFKSHKGISLTPEATVSLEVIGEVPETVSLKICFATTDKAIDKTNLIGH